MTESNNPPLPEPAPDISSYQFEQIREGAPPRRAQRRAPRLTPLFSREDWGTIIILAGIVVILGFVSGFLGGMFGAAW